MSADSEMAYGERALAKLREIVAHCKEQQALVGEESAVVVYVLPGRSWKEGTRRRLWPRNGPLGRPVGVARGGIATMFKASEVIAATETQIARYTLLRSIVLEDDNTEGAGE